MGKEKTARFNRPVNVEVLCYRHRLTDPDDSGGCFKYALDAVVDAGILRDDSCKEIHSFKKRQEKIPKKEKEYTLIEEVE